MILMKKRLLIDASNVKSTGGIIHLNSILKSYKENKLAEITVLINKKAFKSLEIRKFSIKIKFIFNSAFESNFIVSYLWQLLFFDKFLKTNRITHLITLSGYIFSNFKKTVIFSQNALPFLKDENRKFTKNIKLYIQRKLHIYCIKKFRNVIFVSRFQKKIVLKTLKKNKLRSKIVYHGVDKNIRFYKNDRKIINFLYVSQKNDYKNQELLFDVFRLFEKEAIKLNLNCYGENLSRLKFKSNNIKIRKKFESKNINNIYSKYDAFIFPSLTESFGLPLLEAAKSGLPICASNIEIFKELLNRKNLILFNPKNKNDIYKKILFLVNLNKKKIKKITNSNFRDSLKYSWNKSSKDFFNFVLNI